MGLRFRAQCMACITNTEIAAWEIWTDVRNILLHDALA